MRLTLPLQSISKSICLAGSTAPTSAIVSSIIIWALSFSVMLALFLRPGPVTALCHLNWHSPPLRFSRRQNRVLAEHGGVHLHARTNLLGKRRGLRATHHRRDAGSQPAHPIFLARFHNSRLRSRQAWFGILKPVA